MLDLSISVLELMLVCDNFDGAMLEIYWRSQISVTAWGFELQTSYI